MVRHAQPGGLHRRVHRPDPRLVLHAAHPFHRAVRPSGLPQRHQPRHRAGFGRAEDVQEPAQLPGRLRGPGPRRLRRHALVPDVQPDPARRQPRGHRAGDPRRRPPGHPAAVERVQLLHALHERSGQRRRVRREAPLRRLRRHPGPVPHGQHRGPGPEHDRPAGQLRHLRRLRRAAQLPGHAHQLVRPPQPPALLRRECGRLRRALHRAGDRHPRSRLSAAADLRGDLARPHRRAFRAPGRLAGCRTVPGQPGPGRGDGPGAADLLHRLLAAQGREPARAPAAAGTHGRGTGRGRAGRLRRRRCR
ncbi:hypothetical protein SRABI128_05989 [Microbacterium sp. Bi128]|nr:hypothetical protein SRABI128_05989 [Microbacterium sp. Bi128]